MFYIVLTHLIFISVRLVYGGTYQLLQFFKSFSVFYCSSALSSSPSRLLMRIRDINGYETGIKFGEDENQRQRDREPVLRQLLVTLN